MRVLVLLTDGFGGHGGIAKFNRDLLASLCADPSITEVHALPRLVADSDHALPAKLVHDLSGLGGKLRYVRAAWRVAGRGSFDLLICGHLNLLPIAAAVNLRARAKLWLSLYGVEAWARPNALRRWLAEKVDFGVAITGVTLERFRSWSNLPEEKGHVLPCAVELSDYAPGAPNPQLERRYGLEGKPTLLTVARLSAAERYKGVDRVIESLSELAKDFPEIRYLVVGDGDDVPRLKELAQQAGVSDRVIFAGHIPESEKADHYRLANAFVMPGWGEGFGIVHLEALACGIPALGSKLDGSTEALRDGLLGELVDPHDRADLLAGLKRVLLKPRGEVPAGLEHFSFSRFQQRCHALVRLPNHAARASNLEDAKQSAEA